MYSEAISKQQQQVHTLFIQYSKIPRLGAVQCTYMGKSFKTLTILLDDKSHKLYNY